ncbi:MlaD family protein [Lyngbya aestuarii]|uniref:MlaD family protein n=1 Tax=Lyngbya aestuarii TaxID=118322 RepID=UPI00403D55E9
MRSRTIREGSVGLLFLVGIAAFVGLVLWIRGFSFGNRSYKFVVSFAEVVGMQVGAPVRYRGVTVGKIIELQARTNGIDATVEVEPASLLIPRDASIEANQSGLIGQTTVDITPKNPVSADALSLNPLSPDCNSNLVICSQDHLKGEIGVSFNQLLRNSTEFTELYTNPEFSQNVNSLTENASKAAGGVAELTGELTVLSRSVRQEVESFSTAADSITQATNKTTREVGVAANRIGNTAEQYSVTAGELNKLINSANELVVTNRGTLVRTLDNIAQTSEQLGGLLSSLNNTVEGVNSEVNNLNTGGLLNNLETLSANAAAASGNLRDISAALNSPTNLLVLQQTLDSARVTFENTQKITSDLDELTGDASFRNNLRDLVNGLSQLVSSTQQLEQQVQIAESLEPVHDKIKTVVPSSVNQPLAYEQFQPPVEPTKLSSSPQAPKQLLKILPPAPKKEMPLTGNLE